MNLKQVIFISCMLFSHATVRSQKVPGMLQADKTPSNFEVEKYRKLFWDSLPKPYSWTNDYAWLYSTAQRNYLDSIIGAFEKRTSVEICIVTLDTFCTSKEKFDDLALHIARQWAVGGKDKDNGIVIAISPGYRKIRICNGLGIEKYLSDEETKKIIDAIILPAFKKGDYFQGTVSGLQAIILKLSSPH